MKQGFRETPEKPALGNLARSKSPASQGKASCKVKKGRENSGKQLPTFLVGEAAQR
jgi:hypothetical protein